jgi:hypothetical protein
MRIEVFNPSELQRYPNQRCLVEHSLAVAWKRFMSTVGTTGNDRHGVGAFDVPMAGSSLSD